MSVFYFVGQNFDVGEIALFPKAFYGVGDFGTGYFDFLSFRQARKTDDDEVFVGVGTAHFDVGNGQFFGRHGIVDDGLGGFGNGLFGDVGDRGVDGCLCRCGRNAVGVLRACVDGAQQHCYQQAICRGV